MKRQDFDMGKKKNIKKTEYDINSFTDIVKFIYITIIFSAYLLVMHNKYFDITKTRYLFFVAVSILFIIYYLIAEMIARFLKDEKLGAGNIKKTDFQSPVTWMQLFLICNIISYICSSQRGKSFYGEDGRYMGFYMYFVICIVTIFLSKGLKRYEWLYLLFLVTTFFSYIVAIAQHMGKDFMHYRDGVSKKQFNIFMSTFGNINIYASFIVISLAVAISMFVFSKKMVYHIFAGIIVVLGGMSMMIANSDSVYMGIFAATVILSALAIRDGYVCKMLMCISGLAIGNLILAFINRYIVKEYDKREGIARLFDNTRNALILTGAALLVLLLAVFMRKRTENINKKCAALLFLIVVGAGLIAFVIAGNVRGLSVFDFNYKWGTYRGYIWTKCVGLFNEAPLIRKLFGYGQETIRMLTVSNFHDEMLEITGRVYDNAHNELLQYLLTIGFFGVVSYVGMVASSFIYILKNKKRNIITYVSLSVILGYFVQGLINLNQPITTPLFFVFMAMGVGNAAYENKA
ncbi:MAG: O-antigen ligase family protein [Clostridium sp.]|nr:O-antigen ligase family protein [Clostridium sp.]